MNEDSSEFQLKHSQPIASILIIYSIAPDAPKISVRSYSVATLLFGSFHFDSPVLLAAS